MSCLSSLPWPLAAIDFEASSLEADSYPIEVGLAMWFGPDEPVLSWSALIRPTWRWTAHGHWSLASARVHGLRGSNLAAHGLDAGRIVPALNAALGGGTIAWCDGGGYDAYWLRTLFEAGCIPPGYVLGDWHRLASLLGKHGYERVLDWLAQTPPPHRARADAERLLIALAHGVGLDLGPAGDLASRTTALAVLAEAPS